MAGSQAPGVVEHGRRGGGGGATTKVHRDSTEASLRPSVTPMKEAARQVRWCIFFIFSCNKKEWLIIEVTTLFEYVNNF
jgi:hypothetical protein